LITKLDNATLRDVFKTEDKKVKMEDEVKGEDDLVVAAKERIVKMEDGDGNIPKDDSLRGNDWQKLMNLLMQLRKICDQYTPPPSPLSIFLPITN
jgi:hypothetical protein